MAISSSAYAALMAACLYGGSASGQSAGTSIYTCTGNDRTPVLQNTPCDRDARPVVPAEPASVDAPGSRSAANAPRSAGAAATPDPGDSGSRSDVATPAPARSASDGSDAANGTGEPVLGMTQDQVRASLGAPSSIRQEEVIDGKVTTWTYGEDRVLQFDTSGHLSSK